MRRSAMEGREVARRQPRVKAKQVPWRIDPRPRAYNDLALAQEGRKSRKECNFLRSAFNGLPSNSSVTSS